MIVFAKESECILLNYISTIRSHVDTRDPEDRGGYHSPAHRSIRTLWVRIQPGPRYNPCLRLLAAFNERLLYWLLFASTKPLSYIHEVVYRVSKMKFARKTRRMGLVANTVKPLGFYKVIDTSFTATRVVRKNQTTSSNHSVLNSSYNFFQRISVTFFRLFDKGFQREMCTM